MKKLVILKENIQTLMENRFIKLYDLQYEPGKHYYDASRRDLDSLVAHKSDEAFRQMLPDAVTCFVILKIAGREPRLLTSYEYRYPTGQFLLSPPAGLIDPEDAASLDVAAPEAAHGTAATDSSTSLTASSPSDPDSSASLTASSSSDPDSSASLTASSSTVPDSSAFLTASSSSGTDSSASEAVSAQTVRQSADAQSPAILSAAAREIREETGLEIKETDRLFVVNPLLFSSPGMTDESNALACAVISVEDTSILTQEGAEGSELFDGFRLLTAEEARGILQRGRDDHGNFFSVYTWCALMYFVSGMWEQE